MGLGAPLSGTKERWPLPGFKNLATDKTGIKLYGDLQDQYVGKSFDTLVIARKMIRLKGMAFLEQLKAEGRLWRRNDGTRVT